MWWNRGRTKKKGHQAEFFRGPFDGLELTCPVLAHAVAMPVSPNLLRCMTGDFSGQPTPVSSLALYRLRQKGNRNQYEYLGSISTGRVNLGKWTL